MYKLTLQGNLVRLQVTNPRLSHSQLVSELLNAYYDDEDAVILHGGVRGYRHAGDAFRAFVRAYDRRKAHMSKIARGRVKEFSKRSRHRLLSLVARLNEGINGVLVTFTYRSNMQDYEISKKHLDLVLRYLKYHYPHAAALWRMEHQQRGAIHYHVMLLSNEHVWVDVNALRAYWRELVDEVANINVRWIDNRKRALAYVSKYVAKVDVIVAPTEKCCDEGVPEGEGNLDGMPYSEKGDTIQTAAVAQTTCELESMSASEAAEPFVGRFWGVFNRSVLPLAPEHVFTWGERYAFEYIELSRAVASWARSRYRLALCKGKSHSRFYRWLYNHVKRARVRVGFTIFASADEWLRWCNRNLGVLHLDSFVL